MLLSQVISYWYFCNNKKIITIVHAYNLCILSVIICNQVIHYWQWDIASHVLIWSIDGSNPRLVNIEVSSIVDTLSAIFFNINGVITNTSEKGYW